MNNNLQSLLQERKRLTDKIQTLLDSIIRASIVEITRKCRRKECWCAKKEGGHPALYLSRSFKGRTKMAYLPKSPQEFVVYAPVLLIMHSFLLSYHVRPIHA